jgi:Ricin-type beta-trefoil lectin domain
MAFPRRLPGRRSAWLALATAFAGGLAGALAVPGRAQADPLPLAFKIQGGHLGGANVCATTTSATAVTQQVCAAANLAQRWTWNPVTQQISNANPATQGKCLSVNSSNVVYMQNCDVNLADQRWERRHASDIHSGPFEVLWNIGRDHAFYRGADNYRVETGFFLPAYGQADFTFPLL